MNNDSTREIFGKIKKIINKDLIKVITGVRRLGKSTLMEMFKKRVNKNLPERFS